MSGTCTPYLTWVGTTATFTVPSPMTNFPNTCQISVIDSISGLMTTYQYTINLEPCYPLGSMSPTTS